MIPHVPLCPRCALPTTRVVPQRMPNTTTATCVCCGDELIAADRYCPHVPRTVTSVTVATL